MPDEHNFIRGQHALKSHSKKKENIRVFVQRKRLCSSYLSKATSTQSSSLEQLTSIIGKHCNKNKKNTIIINYRPVFMKSPQEKPVQSPSTSTTSSPIPSTSSSVQLKTTSSSHRKSAPFDVPDVEDPLMFIEMMYQQMFTDDGQLKNDTEPTVLANCVKQIVTQSRRNSFARRDSSMINHVPHHQKNSPMSFQPSMSSKRTSRCTSPRFMHPPVSEEEDSHTLTHRTRTANTSRRSSKCLSFDHADHQQQQLHAFLNSYYQHQKQSLSHHSTTRPNYPISVDDTDNEDLDTFSDLNSYRKPVHQSPAASIDEDSTPLLSSSGYQSVKTVRKKSNDEQQWCPNCTQIPKISISPSPSSFSTSNIFQSIRETFMKYLNFVLISKNILLVPLILFLLRQRSIPISS